MHVHIRIVDKAKVVMLQQERENSSLSVLAVSCFKKVNFHVLNR